MKRAVVMLALLAACRREATPQPVAPLVTRQEPATATTPAPLPLPTLEPPKLSTVAAVKPRALSSRRAVTMAAVDAEPPPEEPAFELAPRRRAAMHPANPDVRDFAGYPLSQGDTPDTYSFDIPRGEDERFPWRWQVTWEAPAADHQSTEGETGAEPVVHVVAIIPVSAPDGNVWMRQGQVMTYRFRVWRDGVLIHEVWAGIGIDELISPHSVTEAP